MSDQSDVSVRLDDRIRLMSAVLAATDFPDKSQQRKRHGTHAHARATRKVLADHIDHPAVQATQSLLDQGTPLEALFTLVLLMSWPELNIGTLPRWAPAGYNAHLRDFLVQTRLMEFWQTENAVWEKAYKEAGRVFAKLKIKDFFKPFLGEIREQLVFIPSISYPTDYDIGVRLPSELICVAPPPLAWGDSPPWPYDERTMVTHSYQAAMTVYARMLLLSYLRGNAEQLAEAAKNELPVTDQFKAQHPSWEDQFAALFVMAAVAMYFETHVSDIEYKSYVLMQKKAYGMALLPGTVSVLRRYLQEFSNNKYTNLLEFLPVFPKQLRVAQKIVTL
jgi:hypothetical protein